MTNIAKSSKVTYTTKRDILCSWGRKVNIVKLAILFEDICSSGGGLIIVLMIVVP